MTAILIGLGIFAGFVILLCLFATLAASGLDMRLDCPPGRDPMEPGR